MDFLIALVAVIAGVILIGLITQNRKSKNPNKNKKQSVRKISNFQKKTFKQVVESTFPKYVIREKSGQIMICEYNHRNEANELVFIRTNQKEKSIEKVGNMIIAKYIKEPNPIEMINDFGRYL